MTIKSSTLSKPYENNVDLKDEVDDILSSYIKKSKKFLSLIKKQKSNLPKKSHLVMKMQKKNF
ncbi:MAG: hypothetical protein L6V95_08445 [Candidatus Melainabacteria bacterium]|nr:MAG: hypothetical protein L6V95_08445 [Candidatus Melainabacteria bacterium]